MSRVLYSTVLLNMTMGWQRPDQNEMNRETVCIGISVVHVAIQSITVQRTSFPYTPQTHMLVIAYRGIPRGTWSGESLECRWFPHCSQTHKAWALAVNRCPTKAWQAAGIIGTRSGRAERCHQEFITAGVSSPPVWSAWLWEVCEHNAMTRNWNFLLKPSRYWCRTAGKILIKNSNNGKKERKKEWHAGKLDNRGARRLKLIECHWNPRPPYYRWQRYYIKKMHIKGTDRQWRKTWTCQCKFFFPVLIWYTVPSNVGIICTDLFSPNMTWSDSQTDNTRCMFNHYSDIEL